MILISSERIIGLQGGASTGTTRTLATLKHAVKHCGKEIAGYEFEDFAPTTRAAALLAESGIKTQTSQRFLRSSR